MGIYFGRRLVIHILHQNLSEKARDTQPCLTFKRYQFSSVTQSCPTLCDPMDCSMPGLPVHHQSPESTQTHVHWVGDAIQLSHPLLSPFSPALNLSQHQGLFKYFYWNFSFNFTPSNEHAGLIFFRMDWLDLLAVQGTLKSLLYHHSSKASILQCSVFFIVQLSHPYITQDRRVMVKSSDKMWSTGEENSKPLQYSCIENPMNSIKRQKIGHWKMNSPGQ